MGERALSRVPNYTYLGIDFACNGGLKRAYSKGRNN